MSKIAPLIVLVKCIHCPPIQTSYSETELILAAKAIIEGGGVLKPLILKRRGFEEYDLVEGEFEYLAAMKARELDPIKGESIDAYVMDETNQAIVMQQLKIFRLRESTAPTVNQLSTLNAEQFLSYLQPLFAQLENRLDQRFQNIEQQLQQLTTVTHHTPMEADVHQVTPAIGSASEHIEVEVQPDFNSPQAKLGETIENVPLSTVPAWITWLNQVSAAQLATSIKRAKISLSANTQTNLINATPFQSEHAVRQVKGIGDKSIAALQQLAAHAQIHSPEPISPAQTTVEPKPEAIRNSTPPTVIIEPCLQAINTEEEKELLFKLSRAKLTNEAINLILKNRPFESLEVVQKLKGVGKTKLNYLRKILG